MVRFLPIDDLEWIDGIAVRYHWNKSSMRNSLRSIKASRKALIVSLVDDEARMQLVLQEDPTAVYSKLSIAKFAKLLEERNTAADKTKALEI